MFRRAQRRRSRLRLGLTGPSGSGKTFSALILAKGLGGFIAMIDSENGSGENYSDLCDFDVATVVQPYSPRLYLERIRHAEEAGYDILVIDSLSPVWVYMKDLQARTALSLNQKDLDLAWMEIKDQWDALIEAILLSRCHIIMTIRSRTVYQIVQDHGTARVLRLGMDLVCPEGLEYQLQVVFDLSTDSHEASVVKDRLHLFNGQPFVPSEAIGKKLRQWLLRRDEVKAFPLKESLPKERLSLMVAGREE
jgi:hypothetical protein